MPGGGGVGWRGSRSRTCPSSAVPQAEVTAGLLPSQPTASGTIRACVHANGGGSTERFFVCYWSIFELAGWLAAPRERNQWRLAAGGGGAAQGAEQRGMGPPGAVSSRSRQRRWSQLGLLPLTAVWGQSPSPMAGSPLFLLLSPWQPASLGSANRKGPLSLWKGVGEGSEGRRAEPKRLGFSVLTRPERGRRLGPGPGLQGGPVLGNWAQHPMGGWAPGVLVPVETLEALGAVWP